MHFKSIHKIFRKFIALHLGYDVVISHEFQKLWFTY